MLHGRHLDHEPAAALTHFKRGVIEVVNGAVFASRGGGLK
jgi:hypothetical protein